MRSPKYEFLIVLTYIAMALVCVSLNITRINQAGSLANIIVNLGLFVIVGIIFSACIAGSLAPVADISRDLKRVSLRIEEDAKHTHTFLWEKYRDDKEELFKNRLLIKQYQDYQYELERIVHTDKTYYKCDISDYIGYDLIDSVIHRESLNQVAGVMTGLGILGTFIGLSLGLQSFNTGTTAEITGSLEPLMDGIKVAFHTSIFGMVFSLVFNYVYKRRLTDGEEAVREFLNVYKKFVMPDTARDGVNRLMELQQQQAEAILRLSDTVVTELPKGFRDVLDPQFERLNETIENFANIAAKNQIEQLQRIVDVFIDEMNRSLDGVFVRLSNTINKTIDIQEENGRQMQDIFEKNLGTANNVNSIAQDMRLIANSLKDYTAEVQDMERAVARETEALKRQSEGNRRISEGFSSEVDETFKIINENLQNVETHFRDTIEEINRSTKQLTEVVDYSNRSLENWYSKTSKSIQELSDALRGVDDSYRKRRL